MRSPITTERRGITLMEVLISIGILAIGLSSVVALVPAGKSQAAKAVVFDRASNLAMNVLNDAVTFGFARPISVTSGTSAMSSGTSTTPDLSSTAFPKMIVFEPLHFESGTAVWPATFVAGLKPTGIASGTAAVPLAVGGPAFALPFIALQGRDDLAYGEPAADDAPPRNAFIGGTRSFQGRTSSLLAIAKVAGSVGALAAGDLARVTAVVFHNRSISDVGSAILSGTYYGVRTDPADPNIPPPPPPPGTLRLPPPSQRPDTADRPFKSLIVPGTVVFYPGNPSATPNPKPPAWYQVALASPDEENNWVYVTFVGGDEPPNDADGQPVYIALDSVGLAERIIVLEGAGPYGR